MAKSNIQVYDNWQHRPGADDYKMSYFYKTVPIFIYLLLIIYVAWVDWTQPVSYPCGNFLNTSYCKSFNKNR